MNDIVQGIGRALAGNEYTLYDEPPAQTTAPYLYVAITPITDKTARGARAAERTIHVDIARVDTARAPNAAHYAFVQRMDACLRPVLGFANRYVMPEGITSRIVDGVSHYGFTLNFLDSLEYVGKLPDTQATDYMTALYLKEEME